MVIRPVLTQKIHMVHALQEYTRPGTTHDTRAYHPLNPAISQAIVGRFGSPTLYGGTAVSSRVSVALSSKVSCGRVGVGCLEVEGLKEK